MNDTPDQPAPPKGVPRWHWGVYLLLLATAVFAALLIHDRFIAPKQGPPPPPRARRRYGRYSTTRPARDWKDLSDMISGTIDIETLPQLGRDPGRLPAPPKAVRRVAYRHETAGRVEEYALYELAGTVEQGATHYVHLLLDEGFQCHEDSRAPDGSARLLFAKGMTYARVTLRTYPKDATITLITFVLLTDQDP